MKPYQDAYLVAKAAPRLLSALREVEELLPEGDSWDATRVRITIDTARRVRAALAAANEAPARNAQASAERVS